MKVRFWRFPWAVVISGAVLLIGACSSSPKQDAPAVPVGFHYVQPKSKTDPDVVEETDSYYIRRYKKSEMIRIGANRVRPVRLGEKASLPIYREDDTYYYIRTEKWSPEEIDAARKERDEKQKEKVAAKPPEESGPALKPEDFESIVPTRGNSGVHFVKAGAGLPEGGQWRQNIAVADINGDGFPDIVTSPNRVSSGATFYLFLGDGHGNFREQTPEFVDKSGNPVKTDTGYGGVAVADFDGDGKSDIAIASHGGGVHVFLQRQNFHFTPMDKGLPAKFSSQGIAAFDVDGDGKIDLVVSRDAPGDSAERGNVDKHPVRVFRNHLPEGWEYEQSAFVGGGGYPSNHVAAISLDGDPAPSLVMGAINLGAMDLVWRNNGKGTFTGFSFEDEELSAYHLGLASGRFGKEKFPAFADVFYRREIGSPLLAAGVTVYVDRNGIWSKVPVWREKDYKSSHLVSVAMGDIDGDGLDDVVFPDFIAKRLRIFYQTPEGKFVESPEKLEPELRSAVADVRLADLNGDGKLDVILAETTYDDRKEDRGGFEIFLNQGK